MRGITKYIVKCQNCSRSDEIGLLNDTTIIWEGNKHIISGRKRLDGEWGFQCGSCGSDDLLTDQEKSEIKDKQNPNPKDIERVIKKLIKQKPRFNMSKV